MKLRLLFIFVLLQSTYLFSGDNPCIATVATLQSTYVSYDASGSSSSGVPSSICINDSSPDFWLQFSVTSNSSLFILMNSSTAEQANIALYNSDCINPEQILCYTGGTCTNDLPQIEISGLEQDETYYLKIWSDTGLSTFDLYLNSVLPDYEILPSIDYYCAADNNGLPDACFTFQAEGGGSALAWLPEMVDFNQSLNHRAEVLFGEPFSNTKNDQGMTMVYSNYAPTSCFDAGNFEDIFTTNLLESFIIELNLEDVGTNNFCRISVNGAVGLNIIAGPVEVNNGDLRDGLFHDLDFIWEPLTTNYKVYFDGSLILSGSYDIINNCLGGSNTTNRGYTAMVPSSNNQCCSYSGPEGTSSISTSDLTLCEGESTSIGGTTFETDGLGAEESTDEMGCPSFTFTAVSFIANSDTSLGEILVCDNEPFVIDGAAYTETGSYMVTLESSENGCDSIISFSILNITPLAIVDGPSEVGCTNDLVELGSSNSIWNSNATNTYIWEKNGTFYNDTESILVGSGSYTLTVVSTIDDVVCSHFTTFDIILIPPFIPIIDGEPDTLCSQDCTTIGIQPQNGTFTYLWENDSTTIDIIVCPEVTTNYSVSVTDVGGCEQIANIPVNVNPIGAFDLLNAQICIGDTLDVSAYSEYLITLSNPSLAVINEGYLIGLNSGFIDITLSDQDGCLQPNTNLFVTIIKCDPGCISKDTSIIAEICEGDSILGYGETGIYADTFAIGEMCDSIVFLDLTILPTFYDSLAIDLCFGDSYNGIDETSTFLDTFQSIAGCDSIIFSSIYVPSLISDTIAVDICDGADYMGYTTNGNFTDTLIATNGCDSILFLDLTIIPITNINLSVTICEGEEYEGYVEMGIYQDTLVSALGCDSIVSLDLEVILIDKDTIDVTICDGLTFLGYTEQGQYVDTTFSQEGCTELRILNLNVIDSVILEFDTLICPEDTLYGAIIFDEGVYSFVSTGEQGCSVTTFVSVSFKDEGCSVGINDFNKIWNGKIYPNPTNRILNIESAEAFRFSLFDINGSQIRHYVSPQERSILDMSFLKNGIYILKIESKDQHVVKRVLKMN